MKNISLYKIPQNLTPEQHRTQRRLLEHLVRLLYFFYEFYMQV